ncbi:30S ribosomal protein S6 [Thermodesulfovibrio sp. 3907-1M]|uniref:Small ribosomal subunit protein bS6 n=1 Tax=Thermodesulfovibrio autotrophicus TaxID=3118333 RepID=A0AAU8H0M2_9BACT
MNNFYEKMVLLLPTLSEEEVQEAVNKISSVITENGGEILKIDNWGKRKLAYKLNKQNMGYYVLFLFKAPSSAIKKMEQFYRVYDPVFKFMIIKLTKQQIAALPPDIKGIPVEPSEVTPKV